MNSKVVQESISERTVSEGFESGNEEAPESIAKLMNAVTVSEVTESGNDETTIKVVSEKEESPEKVVGLTNNDDSIVLEDVVEPLVDKVVEETVAEIAQELVDVVVDQVIKDNIPSLVTKESLLTLVNEEPLDAPLVIKKVEEEVQVEQLVNAMDMKEDDEKSEETVIEIKSKKRTNGTLNPKAFEFIPKFNTGYYLQEPEPEYTEYPGTIDLLANNVHQKKKKRVKKGPKKPTLGDFFDIPVEKKQKSQ